MRTPTVGLDDRMARGDSGLWSGSRSVSHLQGNCSLSFVRSSLKSVPTSKCSSIHIKFGAMIE